ncbi:GntR family transcriptional regulator [Corallococcus exercitus]|uniref:GntR family transcriptional regulator n=1 Tax=Corallococcus exercitus TaxID=2316736 RepID=A0A7Y4NPR7_9BACT|nr:GntR family transcriptional regulator [Corallococcus exercitus]NOK32825.1 GntR family transcriptional regulator [Corallococcus exercitus]
MVRAGLVAYVEEQLERAIALGMLPRGQFGSEEKLAREFDCCRGTVREALRRLAARGLVVQRSGRKTRAVALDESLTLENLGLALHDKRTEECRRLLEGFFSLKLQVLVELLADCCASASEAQMSQLEAICFTLWDAARWAPGARCAQLEFELLRLAAHAAARPGHLLLIQSLQRAMRGNAAQLQFLMGGESLRQWAVCAERALGERDVQALTHQLPALLKACDDGVLDAFAPVRREHASPEESHAQQSVLEAPASAAAQDETLEERGLTAPAADTEHDDTFEARPCAEARGLKATALAVQQEEALEARPCVEERGLNAPTSANEQDDAAGACPCAEDDAPGRLVSVAEVPCPHGPDCLVEPGGKALLSPAAWGLLPCEPGGKSTGEGVTGAALGNPSDCWKGSDASSSEGGSSTRLHLPDSADKPA